MITFSAAIQACAAGGQPDRATQLFLDIETAGLQPDSVSYSALLDATCTVYPPQARTHYVEAVRRGMYPQAAGYKLNLHDHSEGAAETAVRWWLTDVIPQRLEEADGAPPKRLTIVTGWGKTRAEHQTSDVRARVEAVLRDMGVPRAETDNPGRLLVDVAAWRESSTS